MRVFSCLRLYRIVTNMKTVLLLLSLSRLLLAQDLPKSAAEKAEPHEFVISNFKTESGVTLPQARVVYGTYGHLNAAKRQRGAAALALHGELSRLRVADRTGPRARPVAAFPGRDRTIWQRAIRPLPATRRSRITVPVSR